MELTAFKLQPSPPSQTVFFRNIWIVTGELLDAFPARDDQNHPLTHVCVCKGMRGLYTILMDRHCFCWRRLDDGSLSVETSPWLLSFIDLIYVNHKSCAFQKKTNPIFVGCTRIVCFIAIPNLLYCLSPFPLRLLVESLCFLVVTHVSSLGWCSDLCWLSTPMFVNGLLNISFLLSWLTSNFSCFSSTSRFPEMKETSAAYLNVYL